MKRRLAVAVAFALLLSLTVPQASAAERNMDRDRTWSDVMTKLVAKLQRAFGVSSQGDHLSPPIP